MNCGNQINSISFKCLTAGHTFMAAEGIHGHTERALKRKRDVYDLEDLKNAIQSSVKRLDVLDINKKENFLNIPAINNKIKTRSQEGTDAMPYWMNLLKSDLKKD